VTLSIEELDKVSMPEEIKNMIKREFQGLDFRYFDFDYVLLFNRLKKDMTTLSEIVKLFGEEFEKKVVECISRAVDRILEELREFQLRILQRALEEIKNKKSVKALEETILECVKEIYVGVSI